MNKIMNWRKTIEETPDPEREVLTKMKYGYISGYWHEEDKQFGGYYYNDISWYAPQWVYVDEIEQNTDAILKNSKRLGITQLKN